MVTDLRKYTGNKNMGLNLNIFDIKIKFFNILFNVFSF